MEPPTAQPARAGMDPPTGIRHIPLQPHQLRKRVTPVEDLFVLAHLGIPRIDPAAWRLAVDGLVARPASRSLDDLKALPKVIVEAVHQCCGSPLEPTVPTRRVANVVWGGVPLDALLREAGVDPAARYLWSCGHDHGRFADTDVDAYVKDLPLDRVAAFGALVAYEANGAPLPPQHGFPARLVVPGHYGTNSVKWLRRLHLAAGRAEGLFTTRLYTDIVESPDGPPARRPVWAIAPEAVIVSPTPGAVLPRGGQAELWGWAWSARPLARVEVSLDGGASHGLAKLQPRRGRAWQRFAISWRPQAPGCTRLTVRATDAAGDTQPDEDARNAIHAVEACVE